MVMTKSLAQRIADLDFVMTSDPVNDLSLSSQKPSGVVTKNTLVHVRNWVKGDLRVEDSTCLVTAVNRQGTKLDFTLLPIATPFYRGDEPVSDGEGDEGEGD
jgi:hypothetical protein